MTYNYQSKHNRPPCTPALVWGDQFPVQHCWSWQTPADGIDFWQTTHIFKAGCHLFLWRIEQMGHNIYTNEVSSTVSVTPLLVYHLHFLKPKINDLWSVWWQNISAMTGDLRSAVGVHRRVSRVKQDEIRMMSHVFHARDRVCVYKVK